MDFQLNAARVRATFIEDVSDGLKYATSSLTRGEIECYPKHMKAYPQFLSSKSDYAFVLEDDGLFPAHLASLLLKQLPPADFDLFLISDCQFSKLLKQLSPYIVETNASKTTCDYLIGRRAARIMLDHASNADKPIDHKMNDVIVAHGLDTYWHIGLVRHGSAHGIYPSAIEHTPV